MRLQRDGDERREKEILRIFHDTWFAKKVSNTTHLSQQNERAGGRVAPT